MTVAAVDMAAKLRRLREECEAAQEENRQLRAMLTGGSVPAEWQLTPSEAVIFRVLVNREVISGDAIATLLYADRPDDAPGQSTVRVLMFKLRRKLGDRGIVIRCARGVGYSLPPDVRAAYRRREQMNRRGSATQERIRP